ncbi:MAG: helix-turn-helix transcriptional regulator [Thermoplasmata archaeon]|nr:helix-turn-helix transcriptional regulator [Thermoplasmata archaeon]
MPPTAYRADRIRIQLNFAAYPIQETLGVLGRKWAFLVLMKIALGQAQRFNELRRSTPGMSKRILAMRLRELERAEFIVRVEQSRSHTRWGLTQKGADVMPVLLTLIHFGSKWRIDPLGEGGGAAQLDSRFDVRFVRKALRTRP